jgi:Sulfatase
LLESVSTAFAGLTVNGRKIEGDLQQANCGSTLRAVARWLVALQSYLSGSELTSYIPKAPLLAGKHRLIKYHLNHEGRRPRWSIKNAVTGIASPTEAQLPLHHGRRHRLVQRKRLQPSIMKHRTPNIDRIAKEGALFTDFYGQQSCTAGRAAFITGQSPIRTGLTKVGLPGANDRRLHHLRKMGVRIVEIGA